MLTPEQENAALLEAQGASRKEIAEVVRRSTRVVSDWRGQDDYKARVKELQVVADVGVESFVARARQKLLKGVEEAVASLTETLHAVDSNGEPLYGHRIEAARTLLHHAQKVGLELPTAPTAQNAPSAAPQAAVVVFQQRRQPPVIEGTAEDV